MTRSASRYLRWRCLVEAGHESQNGEATYNAKIDDISQADQKASESGGNAAAAATGSTRAAGDPLVVLVVALSLALFILEGRESTRGLGFFRGGVLANGFGEAFPEHKQDDAVVEGENDREHA
jgi:hypothetical protein